MDNWKVPYVGYKRQWALLGSEILSEIDRVGSTGDLILRKDVEDFENNIAQFLGVGYAVGVNSCTDAMRLALRVAGVRHGTHVVTSSHTFLATLDAISDVGATPLLIDSGSDYNMDTSLLTKLNWDGVSAILPVHLNGRMCNMDVIMEMAQKYSITVVEDAAQALGATYKGKKAGSYGLGCFSFFPAKILGTLGDAGVIVTDNPVYADELRAMRDYGRIKGKEQVVCYGYNTRLDNLHAAILNVKFKYLKKWITGRRLIAHHYNAYMGYSAINIGLPVPPNEGEYFDTFQNYVIRVDGNRREKFLKYMADKGVECLVHWRTPLHKQKVLRLGHYHLPQTEAICNEVVSLPMYPELSYDQVEYVCDTIRRFYDK